MPQAGGAEKEEEEMFWNYFQIPNPLLILYSATQCSHYIINLNKMQKLQ